MVGNIKDAQKIGAFNLYPLKAFVTQESGNMINNAINNVFSVDKSQNVNIFSGSFSYPNGIGGTSSWLSDFLKAEL